MQELRIRIKNSENIGILKPEEIREIEMIVSALVSSGGLTGVKSGKTILHFDQYGEFQGIELDYRPWWKRKIN